MNLQSRIVVNCLHALLLGGALLSTTLTFAQSAVSPTYKPVLAWSAEGGVAGTRVTGFAAESNTAYSRDIAGPYGEATTAVINMDAGKLRFGGYLVEGLNLTAGSDLWVRIYQYFPPDFCFSYGGFGDGWGATKWIRVQATSGRSTLELGTASPSEKQAYSFRRWPECGTTTAVYGDINEMGQGNRPLSDYSAAPIVRGKWQALQAHWHFGDSDGYLEAWVDDTYLGRSNYATLKPSAAVQALVYGDYWNGGFPTVQRFYYDQIIVTTAVPNTVDSGGRPFIDPTVRVADFSGVSSQPKPPVNVRPMAPSGIAIQ